MHVVEEAVRPVLLLGDVIGRARLLVLGLCCEDSLRLALGGCPGRVRRGQGLLLLQCWVIVGEEVTLLGLGALVGHLEELDDLRELVMDSEFFTHADVCDAPDESGDNVCVGDAGDLIADLAEALDELAQRLPWGLAYCFQVILGEGTLVGASEVGDERIADSSP